MNKPSFAIGQRVAHWDNEHGKIVSLDSVLGKDFAIIELDQKPGIKYDAKLDELKKVLD